jgi:predicted alpha/beta-fold hydrolase
MMVWDSSPAEERARGASTVNGLSSASATSSLDFRPFPLLGNPHVQTLLGHWLHGRKLARPAREHVVPLPDGDAVVLHDTVPPRWRAGDRIAVLLHGLTGSHASPAVQRLARDLLAGQVRVVRMDLRGAGKGLPLARRGYHAGCSDDVRVALEEVHRWSPTSPLLLLGVSLGGNVALKLAGEAADHPVAGLARVAALGPPIDLVRCAALLAQPRNRFYETFFLRPLIAAARARQRRFPDLPPLRLPRPLTLRGFDDLYTAPRAGFADALDYYRRCSALPLVPAIRVPALLLTARDDPFVAVAPFEELSPSPGVSVCILRRGGHLGFLGPDGAGGIRWAERRLLEFILS